MTELARIAEENGFHGMMTRDHMVYLEGEIESRYPYSGDGEAWWNPATHWPDTWVSIGAMAAVTESLCFTNAVYILPLREVFTVAKAISTAAVMSRNRVSLGVGIGWEREEFDLMSQDFKKRGRRCDEMIEVMRLLWQGGIVEHHGEFYDFGPLSMSPAPTEPVPIYISGYSEPALRRAARLGDGWIVGPLGDDAPYNWDDLPKLVERLNEYRREVGREDLPFEILQPAYDYHDLDFYHHLEDCGVTSVSVIIGDPVSPPSLEAQREKMMEFADTIITKME
ncbi:MAG: TIGR03619 family F420-dependent LLM class oxidoreductase [Gammaproteobacteria bacterium]|nr:TIGR03619 family F420-dependent LLM class oxidoreductase [Gammaproteobacteria bacterium]